MSLEINGAPIYSVFDGAGNQMEELLDGDGSLVLAKPSISSFPASPVTITEGEDNELSIVAQSLGGDIAYTWFKDGVLAQSGGTSYQLSGETFGTYVFRCDVENGMGTTSSNDVQVVVLAASVTMQMVLGATIYDPKFYGFSAGFGAVIGSLSPNTVDGQVLLKIESTVYDSGSQSYFTLMFDTGSSALGNTYRLTRPDSVTVDILIDEQADAGSGILFDNGSIGTGYAQETAGVEWALYMEALAASSGGAPQTFAISKL